MPGPRLREYASTIDYADGSEGPLLELFSDPCPRRDEFLRAHPTWGNLYHLSPIRANVVNWIDFGSGPTRILELGAGCGAITEYLTTVHNSQIDAVEGSLARARVIQQRCRGAENLEVHASNIDAFEPSHPYDVVTLIGVLEYAGKYGTGADPFLRLLQRVSNWLTPRGCLVLAIENRLGHKYLAGFPEDHYGRPYEGINNYPNYRGMRTFDPSSLRQLLSAAGLRGQQWYYPFPDYKLPELVMSQAAFETEGFDFIPLMSLPTVDLSSAAEPAFNERAFLRGNSERGQAAAFMNSLLVVASKSEQPELSAFLPGLLAAKTSIAGRGLPFQIRTSFYASGKGDIRVKKERLAAPPVHDHFVGHHVSQEPEPYHSGFVTLSDAIVDAVLDGEPDRAAQHLRRWHSALQRMASTPTPEQQRPFERLCESRLARRIYPDQAESLWLEGNYLDLHPGNLLWSPSTDDTRPIDLEWTVSCSIPLALVFDRGVDLLSQKLRRFAKFIDGGFDSSTGLPRSLSSRVVDLPVQRHMTRPDASAWEDWFQAAVRSGNLSLSLADQTHRRACSEAPDSGGNEGSSLSSDSSTPSPAHASCRSGAGRVSIILVTYNRVDLTRKCLEAISANTPEPHEVIVVDNASTDGTRDFLLREQSAGRLRALLNDENLGFAKACNQGATLANGDRIVFLNTDTEPHQGWLSALLQAAARPGVGAVGAKLLYPNGRIQHAGIVFVDGFPDHIYRNRPADHVPAQEARDYPAVTGACLLVTREVIDLVGGFDEGYPLYVEDVDLCFKIWKAGYRVTYCPTCVVTHHEGASNADPVARNEKAMAGLSRFADKWSARVPAGACVPWGWISRAEFEEAQRPIELTQAPLNIRWEGSLFEHHSLALVNRELCRELDRRNHHLAIIPRGAGPEAAEAEQSFASLRKRCFAALQGTADIHVRHAWPPDFTPPTEGRWVMIQPWEYGSIPKTWIDGMKGKVDEIWAYTDFVKRCYVDSGMPEELVKVVPLGVDTAHFHPGVDPRELATDKSFKFLFVGGTIARKGPDVLLDAYVSTFRRSDDVCLVIKDMGGESFYRGQTMAETIREFRANPDAPEILYFTDDLAPEEIPGLYAACDCLVHPYRGEGFGLPIAEAMACGLPVVVTGAGAAADFCDDRFGYLIPATKQFVHGEGNRIGQLETVSRPFWFEPSRVELARLLKHVISHPEEARAKGELAARHIAANFTWKNASEVAEARVRAIVSRPIRRYQRVSDKAVPSTSARPVEGVLLTHGDSQAKTCQALIQHTSAPLRLAGSAAAQKREVRLPQDWRLEISDRTPVQLLNRLLASPCDDPILLISSDVTVTPGWLDHLAEGLEQRKDIAAIAPTANHAPAPQMVKGKYVGTGKELRRFAKRRAEAEAGRLDEAAYLGTFCLLLDRKACRAVGSIREDTSMDEAMWEYFARLRTAGYRLAVARDAYVHHDELVEEEGAAFEARGAEEEAMSEVMAAGEAAIENGDAAGAATLFRKVTQSLPNLHAGHAALAYAYLMMGNAKDAVPELETAINLAPGEASLRNQLGIALYQSGDLVGAESAFQKASETDHGNVQSLLNLADLYRTQDRYVEATQAVKRAVQLEPDNPDVVVAFGVVSLELGDHESGQMALERLEAIAPEHAACATFRHTIEQIHEGQAQQTAAVGAEQVLVR